MLIQIDDQDLVVLRATIAGYEAVLLQEPDSEKYTVIGKYDTIPDYQLIWRGNWKTSADQYMDLIGYHHKRLVEKMFNEAFDASQIPEIDIEGRAANIESVFDFEKNKRK